MSNHSLGQSIRRLEDARFLTGEGCFTADMDMDGQLHGVVVRAPYALLSAP